MIVAQLVKKFPAFVEPQVSLLSLQESSTGLCPELDEYSPHAYTLHILILYSRLCLGLQSGVFPSGFVTKISHEFHLPMHLIPFEFVRFGE
jgi:hypothetical protein